MIGQVLDGICAIASITAAYLWWRSAKVDISFGFHPWATEADMKEAGRWNSRAAISAAVAALAQAAKLVFQLATVGAH